MTQWSLKDFQLEFAIEAGQPEAEPVRLENAGRVVRNLATERDRRLAELQARDQVAAQHELISASYVEIVPEDIASN